VCFVVSVVFRLNEQPINAIVFYYDAKAKVYKQVEGPTLVDTAKGGFVVDPFDPTPAASASPYDTFKALPTVSEKVRTGLA
jgi:hypothetical protein